MRCDACGYREGEGAVSILDPYAAFCTALFATAATVSLYAIVGSLLADHIKLSNMKDRK